MIRSQPNTLSDQKGGALITVLILVVILSFLVLSISQLITHSSKRAIASRSYSEIYWRAVGMEALAKQAINRALELSENAPLTPDNPLFATVYVIPMEGASAQLAFVDDTRCLNLNSFVNPESSSSSNINPLVRTELGALAETLALSGADVEGLMSAVVDWIDPDDFQESRGAEDNFYTALPTPYRSGAGPVVAVSELRAMAGVTSDLYRQLSPFLCAHPEAAPTEVNVNHLTPSDAPLLAAVLGDKSVVEAQNIIASRPPGGYQDVNEFYSSSGIAAPAEARLGVQSQYITANGIVQQGEISLELTIYFSISGTTVAVMSRRIGGDV